jgi:ABC-type Fe3+ transport system permease subunit
MVKHTLFLKWWLFMSAVTAGFTYLIAEGGLRTLWEQDFTKLSFLLLLIFIHMSAWCGYKTWRLSRFLDSDETEKYLVEKIEKLMEAGWFASDLCLSIGMVGTVVGFIAMMSGFGKIDVSDMTTVQDMIKSLGSGMSTALYTTLVGLVCSALLKIQYFNLSQAIDRVRK